MSGGSVQRPILPSKKKKVAGTGSKETNRGPGLVGGGRPKGYTVMVGKGKR